MLQRKDRKMGGEGGDSGTVMRLRALGVWIGFSAGGTLGSVPVSMVSHGGPLGGILLAMGSFQVTNNGFAVDSSGAAVGT